MRIAIIPARLKSTRLANKMITDIKDKPMIARVVEQVLKSSKLDKVIVATDSALIKDRVHKYDVECVLTSTEHLSGTDRIAEVAKSFSENDIIINIQGDEPLIDPNLLDKFSLMLEDPNIDMGTIASTHLSMNDLQNKDIVKVCVNEQLFAEAFTRNVFRGNTINKLGGLYKHVGVYGYRQNTLLNFSRLTPTVNEKLNRLEQLRAMDNNIPIKVMITDYQSISIDTAEDLKRIDSLYS